MAKGPVFNAKVTDDEAAILVFPDAEKSLRRAHLKALRGREVEIVIRKRRVQRSLDQNAYLHAEPFPKLAEHFGDSVEGVKFDLMGTFWGWTKSPITGRDVPVIAKTSDMDVEQCGKFIDWLVPFAIGHGVDVDYPDQDRHRRTA